MIRTTTFPTAGETVGHISLDRPDKKNALTPEMQDQLIAAIEEMAGCPQIGAILLDGHGAAFCAGFDLTLCRENSDALRTLLEGLSRAVRALRAAPMPVVIAAHGAAIAGGCALLGGADYVITDRTAKIGYPVVRLGISPAVSAPFFRLAVGDGRARERMLDTALIGGDEAVRIGLAHESLPDAAHVRDRALAVATEFASKPTWGMRATKQWMNEVDQSQDPAKADEALAVSLGLVGSPEERERLSALWKS